jgi:hypothetical protein
MESEDPIMVTDTPVDTPMTSHNSVLDEEGHFTAFGLTCTDEEKRIALENYVAALRKMAMQKIAKDQEELDQVKSTYQYQLQQEREKRQAEVQRLKSKNEALQQQRLQQQHAQSSATASSSRSVQPPMSLSSGGTSAQQQKISRKEKTLKEMMKKVDKYNGAKVANKVDNFLQAVDSVFDYGDKIAYFEEEDKVVWVESLLSGKAETWLRTMRIEAMNGGIAMPKTWTDLKTRIRNEFYPPNADENARTRLRALKQKTSARVYAESFRDILLEISGMSVADARERFVEGLKNEVRVQVKLQAEYSRHTLTMAELYAVAERVDNAIFGGKRSEFSHGNPHSGGKQQGQRQPAHEYKDDPMDVDTVRPRPKLTPQLREECRKKGLCFRCRQPGHTVPECPENDANSSSGGSTWPNRNKFKGKENREKFKKVRAKKADSKDLESHSSTEASTSGDEGYVSNQSLPDAKFANHGSSGRKVPPEIQDTVANSSVGSEHQQSQKPKSRISKVAQEVLRIGAREIKCESDLQDLPVKELVEYIESTQKPLNYDKRKKAEKRKKKRMRNAKNRDTHDSKRFKKKQRESEPRTRRSGGGAESLKRNVKPEATVVKTNKANRKRKHSKTSGPVPIPAKASKESSYLFRGTMKGTDNRPHRITFLRDTGATGIVLNRKLANKIPGERILDNETELEFGDGSKGKTLWKQVVHFSCGRFARPIECYVADISDDLILGTPWDLHVGEVRSNWPKKEFSFQYQGKWIKWNPIGKIKTKNGQRIRKMRCTLVEVKVLQRILKRAKKEPVAAGIVFVKEAETVEQKIQNDKDKTLSEQKEFLSTLSPKIREVVERYLHVFDKPDKLPPERPEDQRISLKDPNATPPCKPIFHLSKDELEVLKALIEELLAKGFIRPSTSPYGAPVIFVRKSDGTLRLCIDYRALNNLTIKDRTPLPNLTEMRDRLVGAEIFTSMDLRDGFYNVRVAAEDVHKTAFRSRYGHFEFLVCPFGLCNSPATFVRMMNRVFGDLYDQYVISYVDDILIYSKTEEEHCRQLEEFLKRMEREDLYAKLVKCRFGQPEVTFCGHLVSKKGIQISPEKIKTVQDFPEPTNVPELQAFLGLTGWLRDFVENYASKALPLTNLLRKKNKWQWASDEKNAVNLLKRAITEAPVLKIFDPGLPTTVHVDASTFAGGGWIGQQHEDGEHPILYWSRKWNGAQLHYHTYEHELMALHDLLLHARPYLIAQQFKVLTDHKALVWINTQPHLNRRQAGWILDLQQFDFLVEHTPGKFNTIADVLSRNPEYAPKCVKCRNPINLNPVAVVLDTERPEREIRDMTGKDDFAIGMKEWLNGLADKPPLLEKTCKRFQMRNGLLYFDHDRLYIPSPYRNTTAIPR